MHHVTFAPTNTAVERLFDSIWNGVPRTANAGSFTPRVDVYDNESSLIVAAEMPGVKKEDLSITLERGVLTIKAEKKSEHETKAQDYYVGERSFGTYERTFRVSDDVDADSIQAHYEDGVLRIELKRKPVAESKKIVIQ